MRRLLVIAAPLVLVGCGLLPGPKPIPEATLADLQPAQLPQLGSPPPPALSLKDLAEVYRGVLEVAENPEVRLQVRQRLADLAMLDGEANLAETVGGSSLEDNALFAEAIAAYQSLLRDHPQREGNDKLLYQLSKAWELSGNNQQSAAVLERLNRDYPQSEHFGEAEFRSAETYFSAAQYARAERAYGRVIALGESTPHYKNALYMQGWSRFKLRRYPAAVAAFVGTLDQMLPGLRDPDSLPRAGRELVADSLHVMAIIFSEQGGADSITETFAELGLRPYQHRVYRALGDLFLQQERFVDSAETYRAYAREFPDSAVAHHFQLAVIQAYELGGFPQLVLDEKASYVDSFKVRGSYWLQVKSTARETMRPLLKQFLRELAGFHHARAQQLAKAARADGDVQAEHYSQAADFYQQYIDSFPNDSAAPEMGFLLAESRFESGDFAAALTVYENVAYERVAYHWHAPETTAGTGSGLQRRADAGYAAILSHQQLAAANGPGFQQPPGADRRRIDSQLRFAAHFPDDPRAPPVQGHAAAALFAAGDSGEALQVALALTERYPEAGGDLLASTWLVAAHSQFELRQFEHAELAYQRTLALLSKKDQRRPEVLERVAASIYRQAEAAVEEQDYAGAALQFARAAEAAPESASAPNARFDAAANYTLAGDYARANQLLQAFRRRHPRHELTAAVPALLVANYEQLEQWESAAEELDALQAAENEPEKQRQGLYLAAQYYDRAGRAELAISRYRSYAHTWAQPAALQLEAMSRLAELYDRGGEQGKRRFWLRKIIAADRANESSDRSSYLAAGSSAVLADDSFAQFRDIKLGYPLKQSLRKKKSAMQKSLAQYQQLVSYGVSEFATLATYRMAEIYRQFGTDLLASERPRNIDTLALEQYELLLEEQAFPFEEKAIEIHEANARRSWEGLYDHWVRESVAVLAELLPAQYQNTEARQ